MRAEIKIKKVCESEKAHKHILITRFLGTLAVWKYMWVAPYLYLGHRLRAFHERKVAGVISYAIEIVDTEMQNTLTYTTDAISGPISFRPILAENFKSLLFTRMYPL